MKDCARQRRGHVASGGGTCHAACGAACHNAACHHAACTRGRQSSPAAALQPRGRCRCHCSCACRPCCLSPTVPLPLLLRPAPRSLPSPPTALAAHTRRCVGGPRTLPDRSVTWTKVSLKEAKMWATPHTSSPSRVAGPRLTFSSWVVRRACRSSGAQGAVGGGGRGRLAMFLRPGCAASAPSGDAATHAVAGWAVRASALLHAPVRGQRAGRPACWTAVQQLRTLGAILKRGKAGTAELHGTGEREGRAWVRRAGVDGGGLHMMACGTGGDVQPSMPPMPAPAPRPPAPPSGEIAGKVGEGCKEAEGGAGCTPRRRAERQHGEAASIQSSSLHLCPDRDSSAHLQHM